MTPSPARLPTWRNGQELWTACPDQCRVVKRGHRVSTSTRPCPGLRTYQGCDRPGYRFGEGVPAFPGFDEEAPAGPFAELGEHVAGLDAEHVREVVSGPVASGLAGHDAGDLFPPGVGPGLARDGRVAAFASGAGGGPVRGRGEDGDQHPGNP